MELNAESGFCDLHLHIVPGIDDGSRSMSASLEILEGLYSLGYRHFVATPHADDRRFTYPQSAIREGFRALKEAVEDSGLAIDLGCGAEYTFGERMRSDISAGRAITLAGTRYLLMELPEEFVPANMSDTLFRFSSDGVFPVLAHPERCTPYQKDVEALRKLANGRALVQVSFRSLAGTFGRTIRKTAWALVMEEVADLVATDCHSPRELKKVIIPVMNQLQKRLTPGHFHRLMCRFPRKMLIEGGS